MTTAINLDKEYRSTRAALVNAGVDLTDSMDALHRDWLRWRDKPNSFTAVDSTAVAMVDRWWAGHLAQFRCLIDPLHVAARAERARKDRRTADGSALFAKHVVLPHRRSHAGVKRSAFAN
jgi:hypothetical protein